MSDDRHNATSRFSDRVEHYVRHRPGYPAEVLLALRDAIGLTPAWAVADVGSGTGISAEMFLRHGNQVFAVEPNAEMRQAAEAWLAERPGFHSKAGTAEATTLPAAAVEVVIAGQAFHWFDAPRAAREFARILREPGWVVLLWNTRRTDATPFLLAYEALLQRFGTDYKEVDHSRLGPDVFRQVFAGGDYTRRTLPNEQVFDLAGVRGRLLSSSYTPPPGHPDHAPMLAELERAFTAHQEDGRVRFLYDTEVYFGHVRRDAEAV